MHDTWEVEQKYRVEQLEMLAERLRERGFELRHTESHRDTYFRHPSRDFRKTDEAFRLRQLNDTSWVTYKGPRLDAIVKTRQEIELGLVSEQLAQWEQLLGLLGFEALPPVCKQRQVFAGTTPGWQDCQICLDRVEALGDFAEIELLVHGTEAKLMEQAQQKVLELAAQLELAQAEPRSYLSQLLALKGIE